MDYDGKDRRVPPQRERWHIGKELPIALIAALLLQTGGAIWWFAQLSSKLDRAIEQISEFKQERYTREDARKDQALLMQMLESFRQTDREIERRVLNCEQHVAANPTRRQ